MKIAIKLVLILLIDILLINYFIQLIHPEPSSSLLIIVYIPAIIIINIIICAVLARFKNDNAKYLLMNAIVSGILFFYIFNHNIDQYQKERLESWTFRIEDTTFILTHWKLEHTFTLGYSLHPGSSKGYIDGNVIISNSDYILTTDTTTYFIKNNYLINFRQSDTSILITKVE
jgi:hypothetical protein